MSPVKKLSLDVAASLHASTTTFQINKITEDNKRRDVTHLSQPDVCRHDLVLLILRKDNKNLDLASSNTRNLSVSLAESFQHRQGPPAGPGAWGHKRPPPPTSCWPCGQVRVGQMPNPCLGRSEHSLRMWLPVRLRGPHLQPSWFEGAVTVSTTAAAAIVCGSCEVKP